MGHNGRLLVRLQVGHRSELLQPPLPNGHTHRWTVFVRSHDGQDFRDRSFVEKVCFQLHDTFPQPKRVVKEPPYQVTETGYAGFQIPVQIWLAGKQYKILYDLNLTMEATAKYTQPATIQLTDYPPEFYSIAKRFGAERVKRSRDAEMAAIPGLSKHSSISPPSSSSHPPPEKIRKKERSADVSARSSPAPIERLKMRMEEKDRDLRRAESSISPPIREQRKGGREEKEKEKEGTTGGGGGEGREGSKKKKENKLLDFVLERGGGGSHSQQPQRPSPAPSPAVVDKLRREEKSRKDVRGSASPSTSAAVAVVDRLKKEERKRDKINPPASEKEKDKKREKNGLTPPAGKDKRKEKEPGRLSGISAADSIRQKDKERERDRKEKEKEKREKDAGRLASSSATGAGGGGDKSERKRSKEGGAGREGVKKEGKEEPPSDAMLSSWLKEEPSPMSSSDLAATSRREKERVAKEEPSSYAESAVASSSKREKERKRDKQRDRSKDSVASSSSRLPSFSASTSSDRGRERDRSEKADKKDKSAAREVAMERPLPTITPPPVLLREITAPSTGGGGGGGGSIRRSASPPTLVAMANGRDYTAPSSSSRTSGLPSLLTTVIPPPSSMLQHHHHHHQQPQPSPSGSLGGRETPSEKASRSSISPGLRNEETASSGGSSASSHSSERRAEQRRIPKLSQTSQARERAEAMSAPLYSVDAASVRRRIEALTDQDKVFEIALLLLDLDPSSSLTGGHTSAPSLSYDLSSLDHKDLARLDSVLSGSS